MSSRHFEWRQPSLKFATSDFRRNWPRWLFWAALFVGCVATMTVLTSPGPNPRYSPPNLLVFFPAIFVGVMVFQFLSALFLWGVEISDGRIKLGYGRNSPYYHFNKLTRVHFAKTGTTASMLLSLKSGKQVEIFLNPTQVKVPELERCFSASGVAVSDDEGTTTSVAFMAKSQMRQLTASEASRLDGTTISVRGWSKEEAVSIMADFAKLYGLDLSSIGIGTGPNGALNLSLPDVDPQDFLFLVNYLCYPENSVANGRTIGVLGRATVSESFRVPDRSLTGQKARFYVPADDKDRDVVYAILASNQVFKIPFTNLKWKRTDDSRLPDSIRDL